MKLFIMTVQCWLRFEFLAIFFLKNQTQTSYQSYLAKEPSIQFWSFASNDTEPISGQNLPFEKNGLKSKK